MRPALAEDASGGAVLDRSRLHACVNRSRVRHPSLPPQQAFVPATSSRSARRGRVACAVSAAPQPEVGRRGALQQAAGLLSAVLLSR